MARIEEKIAEINDAELRQAIEEEVKALKKQKQFGLVFETHSPEVVLRHRAPVKRDATVAKKGDNLSETWQVVRVHGDDAELIRTGSDGKPQRETVPVDSLVVVHRMTEPIYPALVPVDSVQNGDPAQRHHILIEADNYHALQLLTYAYAGKVDCIYIDPPYNSGARDWKYNNDYVDANDSCRHSKWLAMMERRLLLARQLLNPADSVLIVTIDEKEYLRLGLLLEQIFPEADSQMVSAVVNRAGSSRSGRFARVDEYLFFLYFGDCQVSPWVRSMLDSDEPSTGPAVMPTVWFTAIRRGTASAERSARPNLFYPVLIDATTGAFCGVGQPLPLNRSRNEFSVPNNTIALWPVTSDGREQTWRFSASRMSEFFAAGTARLGKRDPETGERPITYLQPGTIDNIRNGTFVVTGRTQDGALELSLARAKNVAPRTVWNQPNHFARDHGSSLLNAIFGEKRFDFPKSLYAVEDAIRFFIKDKPAALILDFFAGSGTTLNAVNLLNAIDGGQRQCILVTNNEVSEEESRRMSDQGLQPGDPEWDSVGICRSVTWPRNKFTIRGKRDDGTVLEGEYQTGRTVSKEKARSIRQLGFAEGRALTLPQRKQLAALMPALPQSKLEADAPWFLDDGLPVSVLWDAQQSAAWLEELANADHLTDIYVVTTETKLFNALAKEIKEALGPLTVEEEEKRPMADGFAANLDYFKLELLEPSGVAMGRQFEGILPILWMMAGARGARPEPPENGCSHLHWLIPEASPFAVLMRETRFREFLAKIEGRDDLTHIFLVTNSDKAFHDMKADLAEHLTVTQLYKSYLDNFKINTQRV